MDERARALSALQAISPDTDRDEWVRVAMAAHAEGLTLEDFDGWSAGGQSYNRQDTRDTWKSCSRPGRVGGATLYHIAKRHGWQDPWQSACSPQPVARDSGIPDWPWAQAAPRPSLTSPRAACSTEREWPTADTENSRKAQELWEACEPASGDHPYIVSKRGSADGLRVVPEGHTYRQLGESMAGALVVPCRRPDGTLATLQLITAGATAERLKAADKPTKLNLAGCRMDGWHVVGELLPGARCYIVEGIGQAWAVNQATGCPVVVTFGWGNTRKVAQALRDADPMARLVLVPDRGKEDDAQAIAEVVRTGVALMPDTEANNYDANDYAGEHGTEALAELLEAVVAPGPRYQLLGPDELRRQPELKWLIKGVMPASGLAAIYGPSASGKSFLALDMALAIAEGEKWFGYRVKPAPVVYVALEGESGFRNRVRAWETYQKREAPATLRFVLQPFALANAELVSADVVDLAAVTPKGAVVIIDTLNRAAPLSDENSSKDIGAILEGAKTLQRQTGGVVVLVHHSGKDTSRGLRGHSSLFAAMDSVIEVTRSKYKRGWTVAKSKEGEDGRAHRFALAGISLGTDSDGDKVSSAVVDGSTSNPAADIGDLSHNLPQKDAKPKPSGSTQVMVHKALQEIVAGLTDQEPPEGGYPAFVPEGRVAVELEDALPRLMRDLTSDTSKRSYNVKRAVEGMTARGVIRQREGWIWLEE